MDSIFTIGVDECGRGCLYGDVVAAAVVLPEPSCIPEDLQPAFAALKDSKALSAKRRGVLADDIKKMAVAYGIGKASAEEIDQQNILQATMTAMHRAIDACIASLIASKGTSASPHQNSEEQEEHTQRIHAKLLIDGTYFRSYSNVPHECIVKGDQKIKEISAASILAKHYRDEHILKEVAKNPTLKRYGLHTNMGYGTQAHMNGLRDHGPVENHRMSFGPVTISKLSKRPPSSPAPIAD